MMSLSRRKFLKTSVVAAAAGATTPLWLTHAVANAMAPGKEMFEPSWESLAQYECPEWFRDAKFGIWAHWSAQCVPEQGDWYARSMYQEGSGDYNYHCAHYGHPSKVGFKEIDHMWKAENWDPEKMIALYKAAGAKYFVALANHHDNFDCFDSTYQSWNAVNIGPKKDIVGTWAKAARKAGLRFGVTVHASHTWNWFEVAQGADKTGPYAGIPYDGKLTKADGAGLWWDGLDPQELYAQNHAVGGGGWEFEGSNPAPDRAYCEKFFNRTVDLIDKYNPDLVYFDDSGLPLNPISDVGLRIASHYYNTNLKRHGGHLEAVLDTKGLDEQQRKCVVMDYERGKSDRVEPAPWQTDTCIGNWHYQRSLYENHQYKTPDQVIKMLMDIVSKNGNLLLNIPVRGNGTIDPDELEFLQGLTAWMKINEEAVFCTRPWKLSGEGPVRLKSGGFSEGGEEQLTAEDFRFTTRDNVLYASGMDWPADGKFVVRTLRAGAPGIAGTVRHVQLLGHGTVPYQVTDDGLTVTLPQDRPCDHVYVLKITGLDLQQSDPKPIPIPAIHPGADGSISLEPSLATLNGGLQLQNGTRENIGYWNNALDTPSWRVHFEKAGSYSVSTEVATATGATVVVLDGGSGITSIIQIPETGNWDTFQPVTGTSLTIPAAGDYTITARAEDPAAWHAVNLATVVLKGP